jgi:hypothetical protein
MGLLRVPFVGQHMFSSTSTITNITRSCRRVYDLGLEARIVAMPQKESHSSMACQRQSVHAGQCFGQRNAGSLAAKIARPNWKSLHLSEAPLGSRSTWNGCAIPSVSVSGNLMCGAFGNGTPLTISNRLCLIAFQRHCTRGKPVRPTDSEHAQQK